MSFKYYKIKPLILTVIVLSICVDYLLHEVLIPISNEIGFLNYRPPATISFILGILILYDQYLWKLPLLCLLVKIPDMSGRYVGKINYVFNDQHGEKDCVVEITQTASKVKVYSYFNNSHQEKTSSKSLVEDVQRDEDGFYDIYLFYLNSGSKKDGVLDCHEGANKLRFIPKDKEKKQKLSGHYFTNRQKQTRGEIEVYFRSEKVKGEF